MAVDRDGRYIHPLRMKARKRLARGLQAGYLTPASSSALARVQDDATNSAGIAAAVNELLAADSDGATRAAALGNLLASYGVGTIVPGSIG